MTPMQQQYVRVILVWVVTLTALYIFQGTFGQS